MGKTYTIQLDEIDLGQILDGLQSRADSWHATADYHETGQPAWNDIVIEECSDADEARAIAGAEGGGGRRGSRRYIVTSNQVSPKRSFWRENEVRQHGDGRAYFGADPQGWSRRAPFRGSRFNNTN